MRTNSIDSNISFTRRIRLNEKNLFNFPQKTELLKDKTPIDFFYSDNKMEKVLSDFKDKLNLKRNASKSNFVRSLLHYTYKINNFFRTLSSAGYILLNYKNYNKTLKTFGALNPENSNYIDEWAKIGNSCNNQTVNINIEDEVLENIVKSGKSSVFIMNHSDVMKDKYIYSVINSFLNYGYAANGMQKECPRPQMIVSDNVFKIAGESLQELYRKLGLLPMNVKPTRYAMQENIGAIKALADNYNQGKVNLFLFPEGTNSIFKDKSIKEKFQIRSIKLIENLLNKSEEVQIVPVGIFYDKTPNNIGNVNIGTPITLKKQNNTIQYINNEEISEIGKSRKNDTRIKLLTLFSDILQENINKSKNLKA